MKHPLKYGIKVNKLHKAILIIAVSEEQEWKISILRCKDFCEVWVNPHFFKK